MAEFNVKFREDGGSFNVQFRTESGLPSQVNPLNVTENGEYDAGEDAAYNPVVVNVPNTYTEADEGKVVSNGALISQTTAQINTNGTHDTTLNDSVVVDVPNSYTAEDEGKVVSGGALVAQTATEVTENGVYNTTTNDQVTVNVPIPELTSLSAPSNGTYAAPQGTAWNEVVVTADILSMATKLDGLFGSAVDMPLELTINAPNAATIKNLFLYARSVGSASDAKVTFIVSDKLTSLEGALQASYTSYYNFCLRGTTKNVTNFAYLCYIAFITMTEDSDPIDLTSATNITYFLGYQSSYSNLRFKPNTRNLSVNGNEGIYATHISGYKNWAIISYANSLIAANGATKYCSCSGWSSKLVTIMGRVESRTDETGTYDFFVEDESGTYSVADFITNVKGWTIV